MHKIMYGCINVEKPMVRRFLEKNKKHQAACSEVDGCKR